MVYCGIQSENSQISQIITETLQKRKALQKSRIITKISRKHHRRITETSQIITEKNHRNHSYHGIIMSNHENIMKK